MSGLDRALPGMRKEIYVYGEYIRAEFLCGKKDVSNHIFAGRTILLGCKVKANILPTDINKLPRDQLLLARHSARSGAFLAGDAQVIGAGGSS